MAVPVLLGLLASQGARAVATRIAGSSGTIRKVQNVLSKNFQKAQKDSISKGKIPTDKTLTQGLTKDQKGLLANQGLLTSRIPSRGIPPVPMTQTITPQIGGVASRMPGIGSTRYNIGARQNIPVYGTRTGGEITRTPIRTSNMFPVPVRPTSPLSELNAASRTQSFPFPPPPIPIIQRATGTFQSPIVTSAERTAAARQAALDAFTRGQTFGRGRTIPGSQRIMSPLGALTTTGLLGTAATLPMMFGGEEVAPQTASVATQGEQTPQEDPIRFSQVLRPTSQATAKEVLNAALLRAGLTLTRGGSGAEVIESALTVGDTQTTFRSGKEALEAGQKALGKDAKISIYQRSDGTFGYQGTTTGVTTTGFGNFFGTEGSLTEAQIKSYLEKAGGDTEKAKNLALADGFTEEQLGIE